jgi:hypothetical protein
MEQADVAQAAHVAGLISKRQVSERLRPEIGYVRISPDGKYVLAQDDSNIYVLTRSPLKNLFRIDAPDAHTAHFTPDSTGIVFQVVELGGSPRVEHWDIASQKRLEVHEIYVRRGCILSNLSPDGHTLACLSFAGSESGVGFDFDLFDTASGTSFFHKKDWVYLNSMHFDYNLLWRISMGLAIGNQSAYDALSHVSFSPDSRYVIVHSPQNTLAMDLTSRSPINLPGNIKDLLFSGRFGFTNDGHFMGVGGNNADKLKVVEFPSGLVFYSDINVGAGNISHVARGDYVLVRPIKDSPLGILDLKQNKIVMQSKRSAFDIWDAQGYAERENGDLVALDLASAKFVDSTALPDAQLGGVRAGAVSPDLSWLAVSQNSRGAVWNTQTGQRNYHVRGFHGAWFTPDRHLLVDFPKHLKTERSIVELSLDRESIQPKYTVDEKERTVQRGKYLLTLVPDDSGNSDRNITFEVHDVAQHGLLWSRHFQERPGYFLDSDTNSVILYWLAGSKEIHSLVKQDSDAAAKLAPFKNRDGIDYVEVLDFDSGKQRYAMAIDTGKSSIRVADTTAGPDRLVVADGNKRLLVYDAKAGLVGTLSGDRPQISFPTNLMSARTQNAELTLYDVETLQSRAVYTFDSRIAFSAFSADGKRLLVLSASQMLYLIDTAAH